MYFVGTTTPTNNEIICVGNPTPEPGLNAQDFSITANRHFVVRETSASLNKQNCNIDSLVDVIQRKSLGNLNFNSDYISLYDGTEDTNNKQLCNMLEANAFLTKLASHYSDKANSLARQLAAKEVVSV